MKLKVFTLLIGIGGFLIACGPIDDLDNVDSINYDASYAVPLIDSDISIQDFLEDFEETSEIIIDPDGLIRFKYRGDVISATVEQMFESINDALPPAIPVLYDGMPLPLSSPDGIQIDYLELKKGNFIYAVESDVLEPVTVTLTMPQFTKDGDPLSLSIPVPAWSGEGQKPIGNNLLFPASLDGYTILPENDSVYINYDIVTQSGEKIESLSNIIIQLNELEFTYAEGFLGTLVYEGGRDTIEIDFFDNWVQGEVYFEEPVVTFIIENSFGIPTKSKINVFEVFTVREEKLPLESPFVTDGIEFPFPALNEVGAIKSKTFIFTKENSNIDQILGAGPLAVDYDVDAITNPDGNVGIRGFITDSSYYNVQVEVDLPLYGNITEYVTFDTFDIELNDFDEVRAAEFKLVADNTIPLEVKLQGFFVDENFQVIDSMFTAEQSVIAAAPVGADGVPTGASTAESFSAFDEPRFDAIKLAEKIIVRATFSSSNNGTVPVKIFNSQGVDVRIGAILEVTE